MKKSIIMGFFLFVSLFLYYCSFENQPPSTVNESRIFSEKNTDINVSKGSEFIIQLTSNVPSGFTWEISKTFDPQLIKKTSSDFEVMENEVPGKGSIEKWKFKALKKGSTELKIKYYQARIKNAVPDKEITFKIKVN